MLIGLGTYRPADHPPRIQIQEHRYIEPASSRRDGGEIPPPDAIEGGRHGALLQQIGRGWRQLMVFHDHAEPTDPPGFQVRELPQARHAMAATSDPVPIQDPTQFNSPVLFPRLPMEAAQLGGQPLIFDRAGTHRPIPPGIVAATTDREGRTEVGDPVGALLGPDERVFHVDSLAKYAAAFLKMSRSSVTRANSRLRRASSAADSACRPEPGNAPPCAATSFCYLYRRLRGTPSSRAISAVGRCPAFSNCTACRLNSGVNRRRWPMLTPPGGCYAAPF